MNCITILTNNVILIGDTIEDATGLTIRKPHSIQHTGNEYILTPFLESHIGQNVSLITVKHEHILSSLPAEKNDILDAYLQKITGIHLEDKRIILG